MVTSPDSACRETYQGDEALSGLLKKHQAHVNLTKLAELMPGIEAAPADELPAGGHRIVFCFHAVLLSNLLKDGPNPTPCRAIY